MNIKTVLRDPEQAIRRHWSGQECPREAEIRELCCQLHAIKPQLKQHKEEKARIARRFRDAGETQRQVLKREMAVVSDTLKELDKTQRTLTARLRQCFNEPARQSPFPRRLYQSVATPAPNRPTPRPPYRIERLTDRHGAEAKHWDEYVQHHPAASLYHRVHWKRIVEESFGHRCHYLLARDAGDRWVGVLPLVELRSRLFGHYAVSLPFVNYGGPLADSPAVTEALLQKAATTARNRGWEHIEYRCCDGAFTSLPRKCHKAAMLRPLPGSDAQLEDELGTKLRAQVNQAPADRLRVAFGGIELLPVFYDVFSQHMRDLGTPVYHRRFFANVLNRHPVGSRLVCVYLDDLPAAAALILSDGQTLEIPWAAALRRFHGANVNMWMYRRILAHAVDSGHRYFDFGRSSVDGSTYRFKKQWGARPRQQYWYYYLNPAKSRELPQLSPDNPRYRWAVAAWKRLPVTLANWLGPPIVRSLP